MPLEGTTPLLGPRFASALGFAATLHATQLRKGTRTPYVSHLLAVVAFAIEYGANEDEAISRILEETRRLEEITRTRAPMHVSAAYDGMEIEL